MILALTTGLDTSHRAIFSFSLSSSTSSRLSMSPLFSANNPSLPSRIGAAFPHGVGSRQISPAVQPSPSLHYSSYLDAYSITDSASFAAKVTYMHLVGIEPASSRPTMSVVSSNRWCSLATRALRRHHSILPRSLRVNQAGRTQRFEHRSGYRGSRYSARYRLYPCIIRLAAQTLAVCCSSGTVYSTARRGLRWRCTLP